MSSYPTFKEWMQQLDANMLKLVGLTSNDIADYEYRDCYGDGLDPIDAAWEALEAAGYNPEVTYYR